MLTHGLLVPHSPALIPEIGQALTRKYQATISALLSLSLKLREIQPDTLIMLSPHGGVQLDRFTIQVPRSENFTADFSEFGAPEVRMEFPRDRLLTAQIIESALGAGLRMEPLDEAQLDFGTSVPLRYLTASLSGVTLVSLGVSYTGAADHFRLGQIIRELAEESDKKIVFVASGELSHKLAKHSTHGFNPEAASWDQMIIQDLKDGAYEKILTYDPFLLDEIGECGYKGIVSLLGAFSGASEKHEILSYEAPGGIGLVVGQWEIIH